MLQRIHSSVFYYAIRKALKKPSPDRIPLTGYERLQGRDYFTVNIGPEENRRLFLITAMDDRSATAYHFALDDDRGRLCSIPLDGMRGMFLSVTYYFKEIQFGYDSPYPFLISTFLRLHWWQLILRRFMQAMFNRKRLVRAKRLEILSLLAEDALQKEATPSVTAQTLIQMLHPSIYPSVNAVLHPEYHQARRYYQFLLESLATTDDLTAQNNRTFQVNGQAFATLSAAETDDRRHEDQIRSQRVLMALTAALVVVGILQVWVSA